MYIKLYCTSLIHTILIFKKGEKNTIYVVSVNLPHCGGGTMEDFLEEVALEPSREDDGEEEIPWGWEW